MQNQSPIRSTERRARNECRRGFSLFEVVLSLAVFLAAFSALSELSSSGMSSAVQARLRTKAILRCESKLAELAAAVEPLEDIDGQTFEDDPNWSWSLATTSGTHADLLLLTVTVNYDGGTEMAASGFSMTQLIRDPVVFEPPPVEESEEGL